MGKKNLADLISVVKGLVPEMSDSADAFARAFFDTILKGLARDHYVKVKGLGTFKVIEVSPRESIDVNTGNRIEISGHSKITFTPDASFKDAINKPFAHLQSVVLNDDTDVAQMMLFDNAQVEKIHDEISGFSANAEAGNNQAYTAAAAERGHANGSMDDASDARFDLDENSSAAVTESPDGINGSSDETTENNYEKQDTDMTNWHKQTLDEDTLQNTQKSEGAGTLAKDETPVKASKSEENEAHSEEKSENTAEKVEVTSEGNEQTQQAEQADAVAEDKTLEKEEKFSEGHGADAAKKSAHTARGKFLYVLAIIATATVFFAAGYYVAYYHNSSERANAPVTASSAMQRGGENVSKVVGKAKPASVKPVEKKQADVRAIPAKTDSAKAVKRNLKPVMPVMKGDAYMIVGQKGVHEMRSGENVTRIAKKEYGSKDCAKYIIRYNNIENADLVTIGTKLKLPELAPVDHYEKQ